MPSSRRVAASLGLLLLIFSGTANGQEAPKPADNTPVAIPPPPSVNDPMLTPMPAAQTSIATWEEALAYVRANSTDLRIQFDEVKRAEAQSRSALAGALTTINLNVSVLQQLITNPQPDVTFPVTDPTTGISAPVTLRGNGRVPTAGIQTASLSLIQPILALATWHSIGTAHRGEDVARFALEDTKRTIALNVAGALVGAVTAERVAELNRIGLQSALERLALTIRRRDLGAAHGLDVVRAQQDVEAARATLVTGDESLRQAREALGLALGIAGPVGVSRAIKLDGLEDSARRACQPAASVEERADLRAQKKRIEVAARNADNVKLQFLPTLSAQSSVSTTSAGQSNAPPILWNIQGVLSWNIWDGGNRYGLEHNALAVQDQQAQVFEAQRRTATIQVTQSRRAVVVAEQSRKVAGDARALAAELDRLTRTGYQEGRGTSLELVVAAASLRQAEVTLALREFELVRARILAILALSNCPW